VAKKRNGSMPDDPRATPVEPYYAHFPEQDGPAPEPEQQALRPRPERIKHAAIVGARMIAGTVGVVIAGVAVASAALIPIPNFSVDAPSVEVLPVSAAQQLVCPGSMLRLSDQSGANATATSPTGVAGVTAASTAGVAAETFFAASDAGSGTTAGAPHILTAPNSEATTLTAGAQAQAENSEDLFGLAAASCEPATAESWLVGGATTTGRSTLVTLNNPTAVAASVDLEVFSEAGPVASPGLTGISVEPGTQRVLSLAGFAPQAASPVVHVTSTGGSVVASLQQTTVRGIEAGGIDAVVATAAPDTRIDIPGVVIAGSEAVASRLGAIGFEDLKATLRVYAPGTELQTARVEVTPEDGVNTEGTSFEIELQGGTVTDLPIDDLVDGAYTVSVETETPAVAAVRVATVGSDQIANRTDFAWLAAAPKLTAEALVAVPSGINANIHLANTGTADRTISLTPISADGTAGVPRDVSIVAGAAAALSVESGSSYLLTGYDSVAASISTTMDGGVAGYTVVPSAADAEPIRIYP
jgi:hypothetical protein